MSCSSAAASGSRRPRSLGFLPDRASGVVEARTIPRRERASRLFRTLRVRRSLQLMYRGLELANLRRQCLVLGAKLLVLLLQLESHLVEQHRCELIVAHPVDAAFLPADCEFRIG